MNFTLKGRGAIITGASQGLGLAIAKAYVSAGADVLMCARDARILEGAVHEVKRLVDNDCKVIAQAADVSNQADIDNLIQIALQEFSQVHILVNNAGVYGPIGFVEEVELNAWKKAIEINLMGSVLMCRAILPHFKQLRYGKIVQLSGGGATNPLSRLSAYAATKAAVIRFAETLAEEVRSDGIDVNAIAPGALNTRLLDEVLDAGPEKAGEAFYNRMVEIKLQGGTPLERGADLAVFLGSDASDGITGKLISAVWDPWESFPEHLKDLQTTDVYTLRRITPKERGLGWGN
jgi:NAD(P)-dependent dehydrogenase (short-subunit alcohol dehydrogenase family)